MVWVEEGKEEGEMVLLLVVFEFTDHSGGRVSRAVKSSVKLHEVALMISDPSLMFSPGLTSAVSNSMRSWGLKPHYPSSSLC